VKIEVVNWSSLLQKLQTDISGGTNADVSIIGTRWLLDFVKDGIAEPLDAADGRRRARSASSGPFLKPGQIGGKTYGLPVAAPRRRALYYNKAMLTKAGFPNGPAHLGRGGRRGREASRPTAATGSG
jgi:multiple sugar transport system substrate-binding protein